MSFRVRTDQALAAFRELVDENASAAANTNDLIALHERDKLHPFVARAEKAVRGDLPKGSTVKKAPVVDRAVQEAVAAWDVFNTQGQAYLSQAEVEAIKKSDPELGVLTEQAYLRVRGRSVADPVADVKRFFDRYDFTEGRARNFGERIELRPQFAAATRAAMPASIVEAYDYYNTRAGNWASATVMKAKIASQDIYALHVASDSDGAYLELYKTDGSPLASARMFGERIFAWDEFPNRTRISAEFLKRDGWATEDGYSEPAERATAGQIPENWTGEAAISSGRVFHREGRLDRLELPSLSGEQREVAYAAFELLFDATLRFRLDTAEPLVLGARDQGTLSIGRYTRPTDGKEYWVANWRDIDDASRTYYFARTPGGLTLATEQLN